MGEVKAQVIRFHQRTGLMHMVAQYALERFLKQMGGCVGAHDGLAAIHVNGRAHHVVHLDGTGIEFAVMQVFTALVLLHIGYLEAGFSNENNAVVGNLPAHFRIEGCLIQHDDAALTAGDGTGNLIAHTDGQHLGLAAILLIAHERGGGIVQPQIDAGPCQIAQCLPGFPGTDTLRLALAVELLHIHGHVLVLDHFLSQVDGKAIGIGQQERVRAGEYLLSCRLVLGHFAVEDGHTGVDGAGEVLFLHLHHLSYIGSALPQIGVMTLVFLHHGFHHLVQEGMVNAQELPVAGSPAEQTAQHIAPAFVAGQNAVRNHKGGRADVIGDDPQGHVGLIALTVAGAGQLGHLVGDVHDGIHVKQGVHILTHHRQTLQAHAGIDVLLHQLGVVPVAVVVELGEHVVPDFHIPVAVTTHRAAGLPAAILLAPVIVNFGAGAAGAGTMLPEIVLLAKAENSFRGHTDLLVPNLECLVIVFIDRRIQPILVKANHLGQEFPAPGDGFPLKIISKGEVAQHLEIGAVPGSLADIFDIAGTDALLAGADPAPGRFHLSLEIGLHRRHAGVDQQQRRVVLRNQGKAGQAQMALALKE